MSHYKHLSINEREMILRLTSEKKSLQTIAKAIGRSVSTVSRELKRNSTPKGYSAVDANRQYQTRRKKCRRTKLLENANLKRIVMHLFLDQRVAYGEDQVRIVENEIRYETGADFWKDTVQIHGLSEATIICGNYLHARASDRLEASFYHESSKRNTECAQAIDSAIHASCYKANYYNLDIAAMRVLQEYGFKRVNAVLACNIHNRLYDGRFSAGNKDWSAEMLMDQASFKQANLSAHPILLDGFTNRVRELYTELDAQRFQLAGHQVTGEKNSGYDIVQLVQFENNRGFVLAHNPDAPLSLCNMAVHCPG